jgi:hypothetical protein
MKRTPFVSLVTSVCWAATAAATAPAATAGATPGERSIGLLQGTPSPSTPWPALPGLSPQTYLQKRNQAPDITADLRALPEARRLDIALALLAASEQTLPLADDDAYPAAAKAETRARWRAQEIRAARTGALAVLGEILAPRATEALMQSLHHDDVHVAALAAERLGQHSHDERVVGRLQSLALDPSLRHDIRAGACAGLGRHRGPYAERALEALLSVASQKNTPTDVIVAAWHAAAYLGSSWSWQAKGEASRGAALRARTRTVLAKTKSEDSVVAATQEAILSRLR